MSPSLDLLHAAPLALPDHVRLGHDSSVLGTIDDPAVTLAIWERASPLPRPDLAGFPALRFAADAGSVAAKMRAALADAVQQDWHDGLAHDVETLARLYATLTGEDRVEVRIERVTGNGCWKFHADYVALRMITTYCGQATQWLPHGADTQSPPRALAPGDVGLFKGRERAGDRAIIHRSPPIAGSGEDRLLVVIDTEWPDHG